MKKKNLIRLQDITFGTIAVSSLFLLLGANGAFAATSAVDEVTITVPASCSLTNTIGSPHTSTIETGVYQDDIGETTFKVFCNDNEGFAVYAVGYTNDTFGNTTMKPSILAVSNAITTGLATSGDTSNWAMKLTAVSGDYAPTLETGFNDYHVIPDTYTKVASYASNTDGSTGSSFKSTYGAFISQTQPADSYTGKVKYTVVHPASAGTPMSSIGSLTYMQDFAELAPSQRASVLNSMAYNTTYNLIDNRDNKTYQIARLKDDNIWMAENLDLGRTTLTNDLTSQNTNIDTNATITAATFNGWKTISTDTPTNENGEFTSISETDTSTSASYGTFYNVCAATASTICARSSDYNATSDICPAGWRLPTGGSNGEFKALYNLEDYNTNAKMRAPITDGGAAFTLSGSIHDSSLPDYQASGGLYWSSTKGRWSMYNLYLSEDSVNPTDSCSTSERFTIRCIAKRPSHTLTVSYTEGISNIQINDVTVQDGETIELEEGIEYSISTSIISTPGYTFSSWSATSGTIVSTDSLTTVYIMGDADSTLTANAPYVTTEIQNLSSDNCTTAASHVRDNRDEHVYTIQRLTDGKCWMMDNLDLGRTELTTDLTSSNTNISTTITASNFNNWIKTSGSGSYTSAELIPITTSNSYNGRDSDPTSNTLYGTLYNYCAASANTICSASGANNNDATSDICPAGWRLPTGGTGKEFYTLHSKTDYNTREKMRASIADGGAAFAYAGYFASSAPTDQGKSGVYWSSTRGSGTRMYDLGISYSNTVVSTGNTGDRSYGQSIRCVLKS